MAFCGAPSRPALLSRTTQPYYMRLGVAGIKGCPVHLPKISCMGQQHMKSAACPPATPLSPPDDLTGEVLAARYRVLARIGAGGMGVVYRAWDHAADGYVVVKVPHRALVTEARAAARFEREMEAMRRMRHPSAVPVIDYGSWHGFPYAVMPYLAGGSLAQRRPIRRGRPASVRSASLHHWLMTLADAIDHVHGEGFVHRDVKPDNILFDGRGQPYLGDFGIATFIRQAEWKNLLDPGSEPATPGLTGVGQAIGTPEYMAPELVAGRPIDGRADQYALAVVVYELLAGEPPLQGETPAATLTAQLAVTPAKLTSRRPELPSSLSVAIERGLAKRPEDRFASCRELAEFVLLHVPPLMPPAPRLTCPVCCEMMTPAASLAGRNGRCPGCREVLFVTEDLQAVVAPAERLAGGRAGAAALLRNQ